MRNGQIDIRKKCQVVIIGLVEVKEKKISIKNIWQWSDDLKSIAVA